MSSFAPIPASQQFGAEGKILVRFETIDGDECAGIVGAGLMHLEGIFAGDEVGVEYFQVEDLELVKIETLVKLEREIIFEYNRE